MSCAKAVCWSAGRTTRTVLSCSISSIWRTVLRIIAGVGVKLFYAELGGIAAPMPFCFCCFTDLSPRSIILHSVLLPRVALAEPCDDELACGDGELNFLHV